MASGYHLTVKKYLDQNKISYSLPEYIQRGWNRIYTPEEKEFLKRPYIIGLDVQIPNSVVRHRLGTTQMLMEANIETLHKAFELPDELFMNLSIEHKHPETIEEEKLSFQWNDEDNDHTIKRKNEDYDNIEPLSLDGIVEEIRTNVGKDLKNEDIKLITELMQIISRHKNDQIIDIYDELTDMQLISKFGGVPKLVQALQEIQKAFEQVAMKTNVSSLETVLDALFEKDNTYSVAVELLNSFNENTKKNKQQQILNLNDKLGDISEYDHTVFNILIKDRISRLPVSDLTMLAHDLETIQNIDASKVGNDRDDQVKFLSEQLNIVFTRAHLDGIKTACVSLREYIDRIENSLKTKLTEQDNIFIESYIHDHLTSLNNNELKIIYERLAQQGILKRLTVFSELNQSITMGLMKKIDTDGLGTVIENMKDAHLDNETMNKLIQALTHINHHIQTQSSVSLEQMQNQLDMAYFIETHNLNEQDIHELSRTIELYSIAHIPLSEDATQVECSTFLEHLKGPFIRICIERILNLINQENTIDLNKVSNKFYNECITDLFNELIHGSDDLNQKLLFSQIEEQLKKNKELPDKLYRQMVKEKLIQIDTKVKVDTDKKKASMIINEIKRVLTNKEDRIKQERLMELFDRTDIPVPERIKDWYKTKSNTPNLRFSPSKVKNHSKTKSILPSASPSVRRTTIKSKRIPQKIKEQLPTTTAVTSSKRGNERKGSLLKIRIKTQSTVHQEKKHPKILDDTKRTGGAAADQKRNGKTKTKHKISITSKSKDQQKNTLDVPDDHRLLSITSPKEEQIQERDSQPLDPIHKTIEADDNIASTQLESIHEKYLEKDSKSSAPQTIEMFQADLGTIGSATTTDGKMEENKTFNFELNLAVAPLLYHPSLPNDPKQDVSISLSGKTAMFVNDLPYEKTKAQRILAKTMATNSGHQHSGTDITRISSSSTTLPISNTEPIDESSTKVPRHTLKKSVKQIDDIYINSLTKSLRNLFSQSKYDSTKLQKIHEELISSGHISPLNEFYRSTNEALRVTLDHCVTYDELIKWTLSLLQTKNKPNLIDFGHDLYSIAIDLDLTLIERIDNARCAIEIQENLKHELQTITENDLREINSYINAAQLEKVVDISKKLNVSSKDRMIFDLNSLLLHLIQACHTFESKYRPMQTRIREISETFQSRAVADLARKLDEIEKHLSKNFSITFFGVSKRLNESQFILIK